MKSDVDFLIFLFCVIAANVTATTDLTLVEGENGADVVTACLSKLQLSKIFKSDNKIMRRIAYVETMDGLDSAGNMTDGGIWKLSFEKYERTKKLAPSLLEKIKKLFGISWKDTTFEDLKKPFYSALGARLFLELVTESIPLSTDVLEQSSYWKEHYTSSNATQKDFQKRTYTLNSKEICEVDQLDIFYLLDDSGSVGEHFNTTKEFLYNLSNSFYVSSERVRVGMLTFEYRIRFQFYLNTYNNKSDVLRTIMKTSYHGSGTNTSGALDEARLHGFVESKGMRPASLGIPRIALVVTDGRSFSPTDTKASAAKLRDTGVIVFAIGIKNANKMELRDMVSKDEYAIFAPNFDENILNAIQVSLSEIICSVSPDLNISKEISGTLDGKGIQYLSYKLEPEGITVRINVTGEQCSLVAYASTSVRTPNRAFNDFGSTVQKWEDLFINTASLPRFSNGKTVFLAVENLKDTPCEVRFSAVKGDKSTSPVSINDLPSSVEIKAGKKFTLQCKGKGKPLPTIQWYFQNKMLTTKAGYNIKETTDTSTGTVFSELIIDSVEEINEGAYTCKGSNTMPNDELKQDQSSSELKVISAPSPPSNVTVSIVNGRDIMIRWSQPVQNGEPITCYRVTYRVISTPANEQPSRWTSVETNKTSMCISSAETGQMYEIKVQAENNDGSSLNSTRRRILVPKAISSSAPVTGRNQTNCQQFISIGNLCYAVAIVLGLLAILVIITALLILCAVCIAWGSTCSTKSTGSERYQKVKNESDSEGKM